MSEQALERNDLVTFEALDREYAAVIALLDRAAAFKYVASLVPSTAGVDVGLVGEVVDDARTIVLRAWSGLRTEALQNVTIPAGTGLGGKVAVLRYPIWVWDYSQSTEITHDFDDPVRAEGLRSVLAVPIIRGHDFFGVLYAASRSPCEFSDETIQAMMRLGREAGVAVDVADRAREMADLAVHEERRRLALSLHDSVGALLFNMGAAAGNLAGELEGDQRLRDQAKYIARQASRAKALLRHSLQELSEAPEDIALSVAIQSDCRAFQERTGIVTSVVPLGEVPLLDTGRVNALLLGLREGLLNVEKHAGAGSVVVTVYGVDDGVTIAIADDGVGVQTGDRQGLGLGAAAERLARLGGRLLLTSNEEGGSTMRAWVPC
jgi:LuxR family transcriptional regulator, regulator of acetate metabolism